MKKLFDILSYKRPAWSITEEAFIQQFIDPYKPIIDGFGNRILLVGRKAPTTMFCCHTDTVHSTEGRQAINYDLKKAIISKDDGECLGADDGTGIWIMLQMIKRKIPGLYIFHRAEEIGGQGSKHIAKNTPEIARGIKRCIAFDRKGDADLITTQGSTKCCSDEFATSICAGLNHDDVLKFKPCTHGSFTDSKSYIGLISECINVSVGYERQHSPSETQNVAFLHKLIQRLITLDWDSLPTVREPKAIAPPRTYQNNYSSQNRGNQHWQNKKTTPGVNKKNPANQGSNSSQKTGAPSTKKDSDHIAQLDALSLVNSGFGDEELIESEARDLVFNDPALTVQIMLELGVNYQHLADAELALMYSAIDDKDEMIGT